jgi:hypothetical protein
VDSKLEIPPRTSTRLLNLRGYLGTITDEANRLASHLGARLYALIGDGSISTETVPS